MVRIAVEAHSHGGKSGAPGLAWSGVRGRRVGLAGTGPLDGLTDVRLAETRATATIAAIRRAETRPIATIAAIWRRRAGADIVEEDLQRPG